MANYKVVDGRIIKVVEEDVTEQIKKQFNDLYNVAAPKLAEKEHHKTKIKQYEKAIEAINNEIAKIDESIESAFANIDKELIKQIEPEKAEKLGF